MPGPADRNMKFQNAVEHLQNGLIDEARQFLDLISVPNRNGQWHFLRGFCYLAQYGREYGVWEGDSEHTKSLDDEAILQFMQGFEKDQHTGCAYMLYALYRQRRSETLTVLSGTEKKEITEEQALNYLKYAANQRYPFAQDRFQAERDGLDPRKVGQHAPDVIQMEVIDDEKDQAIASSASTYNPDSESSLVNCTDPCGYYNFGTSLRSTPTTVVLMSGMALGLFIFSMAVVANPATVPVLIMAAAIITLTSIVSTLIIGACKFVRDKQSLKQESVGDFFNYNPNSPQLTATHRRSESPSGDPTSGSRHLLRGSDSAPGSSEPGSEPNPEEPRAVGGPSV